jgi:hypothetical protein
VSLLYKCELWLLVDLLQRGHPVLDVIGGRQFAVLHREDVDRHRVEALAGGFGPPELALGRAGGLAPYDDLISIHLDVFDLPAQVRDRLAQATRKVSLRIG